MNRHWIYAALAPASLLLLAAPALAQKTVPGEKWRQTMSVEMPGMTMPARTVEMCAPVGKAQEAMSKPDQGNCTVSNAVQSGNKYSADIHCTGRDAMDGHVENIFDGTTMHTTMRMKTKDGEMNMKSESTKLGACEAVDYSSYKPPVAAMPPAFDADMVCKQQTMEMIKDPSTLGQRASLFAGSGASCANSPTLKQFCNLVQSHSGFASLAESERRMSGVMKSNGTPVDPNNAQVYSLTASLNACKAGTADAVRAKLMSTAVAQNAWEFLLGQGGDPEFATVVAIAKRECGGRGGTSASNARYASLCATYGQMLANNDRPGVMSVYHGDCSGDCGTVNGNTPATNAPNGDDKSKQDARQKAKDALDKGKKALKGLFGGG